jgi:hypothetical protein
MQWITASGGFFTYGREYGYLVLTGEREVRLSRFSIAAGASCLVALVAAEATRTAIIFPLGRGPGRPGGAPELAALAESAKRYAERFEAGEDIDGYPHWQRERSAARFRMTGDANDCPNC